MADEVAGAPTHRPTPSGLERRAPHDTYQTGRLLLDRDIASLIPEHPFYGDRKRDRMVNAIVESFDRLDALLGSEGN